MSRSYYVILKKSLVKFASVGAQVKTLHAWCEGHRKWWRCQYRIEMYHIHPHDIGNDG